MSLFIWSIINFRRWNKKLKRSLDANSKVIKTKKGIIEYKIEGDGPAILLFHGSPGGYDQSYFISQELLPEGFKIVAISRPGYLKTPLESGITFEEGADLVAALLDALGIKKVSIIGGSGGGPISLQFALKYPERTSALIMESAISQNFTMQEGFENSLLGRIFLSKRLMSFSVWILDVITRYMPLKSYKLILKAESSFTKEEIKNGVKFLKNNPEQKEYYKNFVKTTIPISVRYDGLQNDMLQFKTVDDIHVEMCRQLCKSTLCKPCVKKGRVESLRVVSD